LEKRIVPVLMQPEMKPDDLPDELRGRQAT